MSEFEQAVEVIGSKILAIERKFIVKWYKEVNGELLDSNVEEALVGPGCGDKFGHIRVEFEPGRVEPKAVPSTSVEGDKVFDATEIVIQKLIVVSIRRDTSGVVGLIEEVDVDEESPAVVAATEKCFTVYDRLEKK